MRLVIGGAFQGKKAYVAEKYQLPNEKMTDGSAASYEEIFDTPCLYHFQEWVKERLKEGKKLESLEEELIDKNPDIILISNELGYGVVPIDKFDREYRETTGRVCTRLAKKSKSVVRIICGMECVLKDE